MSTLRKYRKIFSCTLRDQFHYLPAFIFHFFFIVIIMYVFFSLWKVVYAGKNILAGFTLSQLIWYLCITETIEFSKPRTFIQIQEEVKDGSIAYALLRPYSYVGFIIAKSLGEAAVRLAPVLLLASGTALLLAGIPEAFPRMLPPALLFIPGGIVLSLLWTVIIGLLAFWTEEVGPFYWIIQKLIFILGGLFFPIDFFPHWLKGIALKLPFAFSAYWPAAAVIRPGRENFLWVLGGQLFWGCVLYGTALLIYGAARKKMHAQGG